MANYGGSVYQDRGYASRTEDPYVKAGSYSVKTKSEAEPPTKSSMNDPRTYAPSKTTIINSNAPSKSSGGGSRKSEPLAGMFIGTETVVTPGVKGPPIYETGTGHLLGYEGTPTTTTTYTYAGTKKDIKQQVIVSQLERKGYDTTGIFFTSKGKGISADPILIQQQQKEQDYLKQFEGTTFNTGQGMQSINPATVLSNQPSVYGFTQSYDPKVSLRTERTTVYGKDFSSESEAFKAPVLKQQQGFNFNTAYMGGGDQPFAPAPEYMNKDYYKNQYASREAFADVISSFSKDINYIASSPDSPVQQVLLRTAGVPWQYSGKGKEFREVTSVITDIGSWIAPVSGQIRAAGYSAEYFSGFIKENNKNPNIDIGNYAFSKPKETIIQSLILAEPIFKYALVPSLNFFDSAVKSKLINPIVQDTEGLILGAEKYLPVLNAPSGRQIIESFPTFGIPGVIDSITTNFKSDKYGFIKGSESYLPRLNVLDNPKINYGSVPSIASKSVVSGSERILPSFPKVFSASDINIPSFKSILSIPTEKMLATGLTAYTTLELGKQFVTNTPGFVNTIRNDIAPGFGYYNMGRSATMAFESLYAANGKMILSPTSGAPASLFTKRSEDVPLGQYSVKFINVPKGTSTMDRLKIFENSVYRLPTERGNKLDTVFHVTPSADVFKQNEIFLGAVAGNSEFKYALFGAPAESLYFGGFGNEQYTSLFGTSLSSTNSPLILRQKVSSFKTFESAIRELGINKLSNKQVITELEGFGFTEKTSYPREQLAIFKSKPGTAIIDAYKSEIQATVRGISKKEAERFATRVPKNLDSEAAGYELIVGKGSYKRGQFVMRVNEPSLFNKRGEFNNPKVIVRDFSNVYLKGMTPGRFINFNFRSGGRVVPIQERSILNVVPDTSLINGLIGKSSGYSSSSGNSRGIINIGTSVIELTNGSYSKSYSSNKPINLLYSSSSKSSSGSKSSYSSLSSSVTSSLSSSKSSSKSSSSIYSSLSSSLSSSKSSSKSSSSIYSSLSSSLSSSKSSSKSSSSSSSSSSVSRGSYSYLSSGSYSGSSRGSYSRPPSSSISYLYGSSKDSSKKKSKSKKFFMSARPSRSDVYILPDLRSVSITEQKLFSKGYANFEAVTPRATSRVKGLASAALQGYSTGYVPTEQMRRGLKI